MFDYIEELEQSGMSLIIYKDDRRVFSSSSQGISPHLEALDKLGRKSLHGTVMVDKIVGRAAALLILYAVASESHTQVITTDAISLFEENGLEYSFKVEAPHIKTRDGEIYCPFERMVQGIKDPEKAYSAIVQKMNNL